MRRSLVVRVARHKGAADPDTLARQITEYVLGKPGAPIPTLRIESPRRAS